MKILITGGRGQLGRELSLLLQESQGYEIFAPGRAELDIGDAAGVSAQVKAWHPEVVIHTAAYTKVDQAEVEPDEAWKVNALGSRNVAVAAEAVGAKLIYLSTDYVFDGKKGTPYEEWDVPSSESVYGRSKLAGEELVRMVSRRFFIVRTSWVFGPYGGNFVKTMLGLARAGKALRVVADQVGSPTYTYDLARFLEMLMRTEAYGIYHATNSGTCSWFEFAQAIFAEAGIAADVEPCTTEEFPRPAKRPPNSVLEHKAIRLNGWEDLRPWREGLREYLKRMKP